MNPSSESYSFLSSWRNVELAKYVSKLSKVIRYKDDSNCILFDFERVEEFRELNNNTGIYTSIWLYNKLEIESAVRFAPLYFDLDSKDIEDSFKDTKILFSYLNEFVPAEAIQIFFTGKKGFHIECSPITLGINPSNNLTNMFRYIASTLKSELKIDSLDLQVYDNRRMWRLEGSRHQDTGLFKTLIDGQMLQKDIETIREFSSQRRSYFNHLETFSASANEWFRNLSYEMEIDKERSKDFLTYFNRHGSSVFKSFESGEKEFTPKRLIENCPSVKRLWQEAIDKKHLDHEARLFLCSILTYSEDSIKFLHEILSNCNDYNYEKSNSHIQDWIRRRELGIGGRPFTCSRANSSGVGCMDCDLESKPKWVKIGSRFVETEEKLDPSPIRYAYLNKQKSKGGENERN
jgi:hypothetical protein